MEFSSGHCYEHSRTKNVVHLTLFRKIVIEIQCIDCENDHFWCHFGQIWNFLNVVIFDGILTRALLWTFYDQKCSPFDAISRNCHRDTVYRLWKWLFFLPFWQNMKFFKCLYFCWKFYEGTVLNILGPKM